MKIIQHWKIWFFISALVIVPGIVALSLWGLKPGIDFAGGTLIERQFTGTTAVEVGDIRSVFEGLSIAGAQVSMTDQTSFIARTHGIDQETYQKIVDVLTEEIGESSESRFETVGPTISRDLVRSSILALIVAMLAIVLYIAWAFKGVPRPLSSWKFGFSAIFALIHDVLVVLGIFAILGHYLSVEIDTLFITALLTTIGFSVHDTIVVFDRIRENSRRASGGLVEIANRSILETMTRSLNTSTTTLLTLLALLIFGGASLFWFILALVIGITAGTYSSIFIASVIVVLWHRGNR